MRRNYERVGLIIVAILTVCIMGASIHFERQLSQQKSMYYQLQALRTAVNLYKILNKKNPKNLAALSAEEYTFPGESRPHRYLYSPMADDEGRMMDPFGNPYEYNEKNGWVSSSTAGYEYW